MGRKMKPHKPLKDFGRPNPFWEGACARERGIDTNPYRQGTDDYKRWKEGYRKNPYG